MRKELTKKQLEAILTRLKEYYGAIKDVADEANRSSKWVTKVLTGEAKYDSGVVKAALEVLRKRDEKEEADHREVLAKMARLNIA